MLTAILTAIFGLAGVIIGGSITYTIEERRAHREERKEQRKRLAELKQAALLVDDDFGRAMSALEVAIQIKSWPADLHNYVKLEIWREHRALLASETTLRDWIILRRAARKMELFKTLDANIKSENRKVDEQQVTDWRDDRADIQQAREALKPLLDPAAH